MQNVTTRAHYEKYRKLSEKVTSDTVPKQCDTKEKVRALFEGDKHLNNVPLSLWDKAAGAHFYYGRMASRTASSDFWLSWDVPWTPDIANHLSLAERVCVLKHIAIYRIGEIEPVFED